MASPRREGDVHEAEGGMREARAQRILDAASRLILRYGYHKTSIEDIAREAGVGKGTLYLHWKTREELFTALILREKVAMAEDIQQGIAQDPAGAALRGFLRHAALALMRRPLLKAVLLRDTGVFGEFIQREKNSAIAAEALAGFTTYLQGLRDQGLARTDLPLQAQAAILSSIFLGFFLAAPLLPDAFKPSDEDLAELMGETAHRALAPPDPAPSGAIQVASHNLNQYLDRSLAMAQEQQPEDDRLNARPAGRARGRNGGRSRKLMTAARVAEARRLYADRSKSIAEICTALGISRASLYRYVKEDI